MGAVRLTDNSQGHPPWPPRPPIEASTNVFINGIPSVRLGDNWAIHCAPPCHGGVSSEGSPNVFVNGKAMVRTGDAISCGDHALQASPDVIVNGK